MGSAPNAAAADLPALATNPKFIFFTDFDGTITLQDSNDYMTDNLGFGVEKRTQGNKDVLFGKRDFRSSFQEMLDSVSTPFDECVDILLKNVKLDPGFKAFFDWSRTANVPIVVLSGGMTPVIRALLAHLVGHDCVDHIQIVSNDVAPRPGKDINEKGGWHIRFHDDSPFGHDKSIEIRKYSQLPKEQRPTLFYAGDGVSDLSAARETDLMFAKEKRDLVAYCKTEGIPYEEFADFSSILATVKAITEGKTTIEEAANRARQH